MTWSSKKDKSSLKALKTANFRNLVIFGFIAMLSLSCIRCANMQRPTGGPKDSIPPKLLAELPENFTRNFKEKRIRLTFDEFIKINNQFKEFSISPDVDDPVIYKVNRKNLVITLPDSLEENTTYTINFGKGLVDYNEGNPIVNYNYVFATGNELDSLSISGSVRNGFTKSFDQKRDENIKVLLIPTRQDSIFGKRKANIYTNVDTGGNFKFNNLREDSYRIYALKEQNNDRIFNGNDEWIGFLEDSIVLNKDTSGIKLELTKAYPKDFRIIERKMDASGHVLLTFNRPLENPSTTILFPKELDSSKVEKFGLNKDSLKIYIENRALDSLKIVLKDGENSLDTLLIRVSKSLKFNRELKPSLNINNKVDKIRHIQLTASGPLSTVDKDKILLNEDSVSRRNFQFQRDSLDSDSYHIRFNWRPKKNYELIIQENAMKSPFGDTNKEFKALFTCDESNNYGNIFFTVNGLDTTMNYIVEVINEQKDKVFDRRKVDVKTRKIAYENFPAGKYSLRIIYDENGNGRWDPADVYAKKQAEHIWYLGKTFTIRENWDQNETVELTSK